MHIDVKVSVWKRIELPESASKDQILSSPEIQNIIKAEIHSLNYLNPKQ